MYDMIPPPGVALPAFKRTNIAPPPTVRGGLGGDIGADAPKASGVQKAGSEGVSFSPQSMGLWEGETKKTAPTLTAVYPTMKGQPRLAMPIQPKPWTFTSENPAVATVDANGNVKGVKAGQTRIKAAGLKWHGFMPVMVSYKPGQGQTLAQEKAAGKAAEGPGMGVILGGGVALLGLGWLLTRR